jgi:AcrR family transcriptional regulator
MSHARRRNDSAYKYLFSSKAIVHQLLTRFVDDKMMSRVRPEDIEPVDKSFVGDAFLDRESDVIYRVNVDGHEVYIYVLIEFQSTVDKSIPIRMLHYILGLYDQMYRTSTAGKLPAVFPILLYNGTERWTVPRNVRELIQSTIAARYVPSFEYYAIIERDIPEETLGRIQGVLSAVIYLEKRRDTAELRGAIRPGDRNGRDRATGATPDVQRCGSTECSARRSLTSTNDRIDELRGVRSMLSDVIEQMRDEFRQEGLQEGLQEARRAGALRMLRKGYPMEEVMEITELSRDEIQDLVDQVAAAASPDPNA